MAEAEAELRFDGRVAVVTGAGRGLGRAYAMFLAARGAKVVVNDVGAERTGEGQDAGPAEGVVRAIEAAGGTAIANYDTVATEAGGQAIIAAAIARWGRLDILIQNAGNSRRASLAEMTFDDFDAVVKVHLYGAFNVVRPAFKIMCAAGYGRIVMTSSAAALYGTTNIIGYATCKAGATAMSNTIATEGAACGVTSNCIMPGAITRMAEGRDTSSYPATMQPEDVAPIVGWLAHESCTITGENLIAMANRVARAYWAETPGIFRPEWSMEDIAHDLAEIRVSGDPWVLPALTGFEEHISRSFAMNDQ